MAFKIKFDPSLATPAYLKSECEKSDYKFKFAANLSMMFDDNVDFTDRFTKAKALGFKAVESHYLYQASISELVEAQNQTGLPMIMITSPSEGEEIYEIEDDDVEDPFGLCCVPTLEHDFNYSIKKAAQYALYLNCQKIHILSGMKLHKFSEEKMYETYIQNLQTVLPGLEEYNIVALIEPICPEIKYRYFMDSFEKAVRAITEINSPNLKLLLDVYQLHMIEGDVISGIKKYIKYAGHVQVAQAPNRREPFYSRGDEKDEIPHAEVFQLLEELKYDGYIGLEYIPSDPETSHRWLDRYRVA